ncbi:transposase [Streptomyces sp. NPDC059063]|uniref:transposase n=1 Tax=unclassified Streptomyces TaxID=2593676 RepID=UPI003695EA0C
MQRAQQITMNAIDFTDRNRPKFRPPEPGSHKRTYAAVAADVGVTGETLRGWVRQAEEHAGRDHGRGEPAGVSRDEELVRLRAENGRLREAEKE